MNQFKIYKNPVPDGKTAPDFVAVFDVARLPEKARDWPLHIEFPDDGKPRLFNVHAARDAIEKDGFYPFGFETQFDMKAI